LQIGLGVETARDRMPNQARTVSETLMTTIYVGNLPFTATEDEVRSLFERYGKVDSVKLINDRETGRPRGFAFVDMGAGEAQNAIQQTNGFQMGGRPLRVNEAQERSPRSKPPGGGGGSSSPRRW
jgi:RNA recognition motif-containing protein